jgi:outer membrane protein
MRYVRHFLAVVALAGSAGSVRAQSYAEVSIDPPKRIPFIQPILSPFNAQKRYVGPAKLTNSPRLDQLVRGGNLYLNVDDVIALTLENNLDIAIQRYGAYLAKEVLMRTESGQAPRGFAQPIASPPSSISTAGVTVGAVGLAGGGSGVSSGGGLIATIGATPVLLDPTLSASFSVGHSTTPESLTTVSSTSSLVADYQQYSVAYTQSFTPGTTVQLDFAAQHYHLNSPANALNPYSQGILDFNIAQNLLQGLGRPVNNRYIRMSRNNAKVNDLNFKLQVITTVAGVLNLYWDLVSFDEDLRVKQKALETAQQLLEDNKHQAELGTLPAIEVTRAEAEVSQTREDLLISQTNVAQQEIILKNVLSRKGAVDSSLDAVHVVPLDHIQVPEKEEVRPVGDLVEDAIANRPEIQQAKLNLDSQKIATTGTRSAILPSLTAFADINNAGLTGTPNSLCPTGVGFCQPLPYFVGGTGNLFGQIFRRDFPNYSAGFSLNIPFRNRAAQADYVDDMLTLRQTELQFQRAANDVKVQVRNAVISLQQARARYENAVASRKLAEQTLEAEQMRFKFGESTIATVVQAQRDLATNQTAEIQSIANYTHAKIAFDQAQGRTLDVNHVSIEEAVAGKVGRESSVPADAPKFGGQR